MRHDKTPAWATSHTYILYVNTRCNYPPTKEFGVYELDRSVFFPGPLGAWYEKNVPHDGGKFLHCQRDFTTCTFVSGVLRSMLSLLFSIHQLSLGIISPPASVHRWVFRYKKKTHMKPNPTTEIQSVCSQNGRCISFLWSYLRHQHQKFYGLQLAWGKDIR